VPFIWQMGVLEVRKPGGKVILIVLPAVYDPASENCIWYVEDCPTTRVLSDVTAGDRAVDAVVVGSAGKTTFPKVL
jgi:hypothetical protein